MDAQTPSSASGTTQTTAASLEGVEQQLASIDTGRVVDGDDPIVDSYTRALDQLAGKCGDSRRFLGDMAVRAVEVLRDEGVQPLGAWLGYILR